MSTPELPQTQAELDYPRPDVDALELARQAIERDVHRRLMTAPQGEIEKLREVYDWLEREKASTLGGR